MFWGGRSVTSHPNPHRAVANMGCLLRDRHSSNLPPLYVIGVDPVHRMCGVGWIPAIDWFEFGFL